MMKEYIGVNKEDAWEFFWNCQDEYLAMMELYGMPKVEYELVEEFEQNGSYVLRVKITEVENEEPVYFMGVLQ